MLGFDRGDTLVEVMFAIGVFSLVSVMGISIMNQATNTSMRALQITLVRQEIDAQVEVLRFLNNSYIAAYKTGVSSYPIGSLPAEWIKFTTDSSLYGASDDELTYDDVKDCPTTTTTPKKSFILNSKTAKIEKGKYQDTASSATSSSAQVVYDASGAIINNYGIWIQAKKSTGDTHGSGGYIDFYIKACWDNPGQTMPLKDATVLRLYEPRP